MGWIRGVSCNCKDRCAHDREEDKLTYDRKAIRDAFKEIGNQLLVASTEIIQDAPSAWVEDIHAMHVHYGFHDAVAKLDATKLRALVDFRIKFLREELNELELAEGHGDAEEIVDALIDLCVVAIGTLDLLNVDAKDAWDSVHAANMAKEVGVKESRPNPLGLPDLVKPQGWQAPNHHGNHGLLTKAYGGD